MLEYQVGQFYKVHSDYIDQHRNSACGIRVATFFLYLNDVEEGGGTRFPNLDLTVEPKYVLTRMHARTHARTREMCTNQPVVMSFFCSTEKEKPCCGTLRFLAQRTRIRAQIMRHCQW